MEQMITDKREELEAIRITLSALAYQDLSISKTVETVINYLYNYYQIEENDAYLKIAYMHIYVYLELGFVYDEHQETFEKIFKALNIEKRALFKHSATKQKETTKSDIKRIIRRWSSSKYHTQNIHEVIDEILTKLNTQQQGVHYYHSNKNPKSPHLDDIYELVITDLEAYIRDVKRNKYYKLSPAESKVSPLVN